MNKYDRTGQRFGMLLLVEITNERKRGAIVYLCQCDCGVRKKISIKYLRRGDCISCGCYNKIKTTKHGMTRTPTYVSWQSLIARCIKLNNDQYKYYGGRGITVCERWLDKNNGFINFLSDMGERPQGKTIDRIDNNGNYCPENCKWSDAKTQNRNRKCSRMIEYNGETLNLIAWAERTGINEATISSRLKMGWSVHDALNKPVMKRKNNIQDRKTK